MPVMHRRSEQKLDIAVSGDMPPPVETAIRHKKLWIGIGATLLPLGIALGIAIEARHTPEAATIAALPDATPESTTTIPGITTTEVVRKPNKQEFCTELNQLNAFVQGAPTPKPQVVQARVSTVRLVAPEEVLDAYDMWGKAFEQFSVISNDSSLPEPVKQQNIGANWDNNMSYYTTLYNLCKDQWR